MRSKQILSIVAFITAFGLSAAFASLFIPQTEPRLESVSVVTYQPKTNCFKYKNNSTTANNIAGLIRQDKANGRESERAYYRYGAEIFSSADNSSISGYAAAVESYVDSSSSMSVSNLPGDFQIEWQEHMKAWREYSEFLNRMKKPSNRAALSDDEIKEIDEFHNREITRTWNEVLQNGRNYGANVY